MIPREDSDLIPFILAADPDDLGLLVDYITDSGKGRLSLENQTMSTLIAAKARGKFSIAERMLVAHEFQLFGGNTFANIARKGQGVPYAEILGDVASRLKAKPTEDATLGELEDSVLQAMLEKAWGQMSPQEQEEFVRSSGVKVGGLGQAALAALIALIKANGFRSYQFAAIVANAVARQILGRGLAFGAMAPVMQGMAALAGPLGWAVTALWTGYDLASPGYRVTVPCVIQIIYMRRKHLSVDADRNS